MASNTIAQAVRKSRALGPSVKSLLSQYQLDLSQIVPTGPHQTLLKGDVLAYLSQKNFRPNNLVEKVPQQISTPGTASTSRPNFKARVFHVSDNKFLESKYARKHPSQLEIDVINAGGLAAI